LTSKRNPKFSRLQTLMDSALMPVRALFIGEENRFHLSSIRDERMRMVAKYCSGRVLDIGCGPGNRFINEYIGPENGIGIDVFAYEGVNNIVENMAKLPFGDAEFETVTLVAVGGHIPKDKRVAEFIEFARILKPGGRLIMTEGEIITQTLRHKWLELISGGHDMDSERGMDEKEEYAMPRSEILTYLNTPPLRLVRHERFMWRLNNVYVAEKG
jgi:SAM-dependent methyltransferase